MTLHLAIDVDNCMGSGSCVADFPQAFDFDEDELTHLHDAEVLSDEEIVRVARRCPSQAIVVTDDKGVRIET